MAVRRRWRLWKPGQRAEEKGIPTRRSQASIPLFLSRSRTRFSTISSRNRHRRIPVSPSLRLFPSTVSLSLARSFSFSLPSFSFFLSVSRMTSHVSPEKLTRALRLPYPLHGSFRVLLASVDFQGNSFPTPFPLAAHLSIYLSICVSFSVPSYLPIPLSIYSPVSFSLPRDSLLSFPPYWPPPSLASCANVFKSVYDITTCSHATSSPTDFTEARLPYPYTLYPRLFYFPPLSPRTSLVPIPLTPSQCSWQTV